MSPPQPVYHLLLCRESREPVHETYADRDQLVTALRALRADKRRSDGLSVYIFRGERLLTTTPPFVFLVDGETSTPLFDMPTPGAVCQEGRLLEEAETINSTNADYAAATNQALADDHRRIRELNDEPLTPEEHN